MSGKRIVARVCFGRLICCTVQSLMSIVQRLPSTHSLTHPTHHHHHHFLIIYRHEQCFHTKYTLMPHIPCIPSSFQSVVFTNLQHVLQQSSLFTAAVFH